jgi:hypothetical protein
MKKLTIFLMLILASCLTAQDDQNNDDRSVYSQYLDDNVLDFIYKSRPMVEVNYGYGSPVNKNITTSFENIGNWDLKLGKSEMKNFSGILVDLNERYMFASYLSSSTQNISETDNSITTKSYRFGFGSRDGVGFGGSGFSLVPYVAQDFVWTKLSDYKIPDCQLLVPPDMNCPDYVSSILDNYYGTFRFGDKASYGVHVELASMIQLTANYETAVVYRRHLFWYWSGSMIVSQIGYDMLSRFTDEIVDSSPVIGSIFNFVLKAGYQYGYYLLRQEDMNWPFNPNGNEAPLTFETVNVGFTFLF